MLGAFPKMYDMVYSALKAAMRCFSTGLRSALKDKNVNVVEFIPPVTETRMTTGRRAPKMPVKDLIMRVMPQLKRRRRIVTVPKMRFFLWIAFLFPGLAHRILG